MTSPSSLSNRKGSDRADLVADILRDVRARYDALERGHVAQLRRCRAAAELQLQAVYWRIVGDAPKSVRHVEHVVLMFPLARHRTNSKFAFGRFLGAQLGDNAGAALRFRRLISVEDRDELDHRLRAILRLTASGGGPVDWGILGRDIVWFFAESDSTRRRWAQDFYAPLLREPEPTTNPADHPPTT